MKKVAIIFLCLTVLLGIGANTFIYATEDKMKEKKVEEWGNTTCPVMGGEISKDYYTDYKGKRVYFCCPSCIKEFNAHPEKYAKNLPKLKKEEVFEQKICPVMGGEINKKYYADYQGERIYFCCPSCVSEFNKNPEKYMKKFNEMKEEALKEKKKEMESKKKEKKEECKGGKCSFCTGCK